MNCIVSNNIIRRPRSCGIQNNGAPLFIIVIVVVIIHY
eukprot:SAG31_NODE_7003_length_1822_cov_2.189785_2_plen_37_part_01